MWRGGIEDSWTYFGLETSGQREVHLKQSKGRLFLNYFFNTQHVVKPGHALCGGSINWFPKGCEKLMEHSTLVTIKDDSFGMQLQLWEPNGFQSLNSMFPILLPQALSTQGTGPDGCWVRCAFMSYNMGTNSYVLTHSAASELCTLISAKPYKRSLFHNTCFFSRIGGNTSYLASHADILHYKHCHYRFRSTSQSVKRKTFPGQNAPSSWGGHLSYANWIAP